MSHVIYDAGFSLVNSVVNTVFQDSAVAKICSGTTSMVFGAFTLAKSHLFSRPFAFFMGKKVEPIKKGRLLGCAALIACGAVLVYVGVEELRARFFAANRRFDACQVLDNFCAGNSNIRRSKMPQLDENTTARFISTLEEEGLVERIVMSVTEIKPTQNEIFWKKATQIAADSTICQQSFTFIVSEDGHILDGHHRWAGGRIRLEQGLEQECSFQVARVKLPTLELVERANRFPGVAHLEMGQF
jgi:hypothetical protein